MQLALRPFTTAGIALVGAGVIAVSPLAPPPVTAWATTTTISTAQVALTSTVDPLTRLGQVAAITTENLGELADYWMKNPAPVTRQVITNLMTYAEWVGTGFQNAIPAVQSWAELTMAPAISQAFELMLAGQPQQAATVLSNALGNLMFAGFPLMNLLSIPNYMAQHFTTVVSQIISVSTMSSLVGIALGVPSLTLQSLGTSAQDALDSFNAGDVGGGLSAIVNTPIDLADHILNSTNGGLIDVHYWGACGCRGPIGGAALNLLLKLPERLAPLLALPAATTDAAPLAVSPTGALGLPAASSPETEAAGTSAPAESQESAPAADDTAAAVNVSSQGANELSDADKTASGKTGNTKSRQGQKLRASVQTAADQVDKGIKKLSSNIEKSVKKISDRISTAGKKKAGASSAASSTNDKAGSSAASSVDRDKTGSDD